MRQALHIFAKDVRLYWIEAVATLTVMALFVWIYPMSWAGSPQGLPVWPWVPGAITALIPVSWLVLITRVIHAESLVGERQFWITRPYRWAELLAAKALFVGVFVYLPFFAAQCMLLRAAGMQPFRYLPGMSYNLLLATGIAVLPMACLAAVTSNFARMLLGLLCILLFVAGVAYLNDLLPSSSTSDSLGDVVSFVIPVAVFIAVLMIQYTRRRTMLARWLLVALAITLGLSALFTPENTMMGITYPVRRDVAGLQLAFKPIAASNPESVSEESDRRELTLSFPIQIAGIPPETAVRVDNARATVTGPGGLHWTSHWQGLFMTWLPGQTDGAVSLKVSRSFYAQVKDKPISVDMSLALTMLKAGKVTRTVLPSRSFLLPGGSVCRTSGVWGNDISCLSPMRMPPLTLVATQFTTQNCSATPPSNDGDRGLGWIGTLDTQPAEFGMTSVWESSVYFQRFSSTKSADSQHLCPGSPLNFVPYEVVARRQQQLAGQFPDMRGLIPSQF